MKIKSIKATLHRFEVKVPLLKKPVHRQAVICEVETANGLTGMGLTGGHFLPQAVCTALNKEFLPVMKDMDARETEALHEKVWWTLNQRTMTGVVSSALTLVRL